MKSYRIPLFAVVATSLAVLSACGGGGSGSTPEPTAQISAAFSVLGTIEGLTSSAVAKVFDEKYLDMGMTKAMVLASLSDTSQALSANPDLSLFPIIQVSNATLTGCDANDVCTMSATLTNSDVDTTSADFTTKVKVVGGVVYLYGDQSAASSI